MLTADYWRERGQSYERDFRYTPAFVAQEERLMAHLDGLAFGSVLDVGCGFGRIGRLIVERYAGVTYTGLDVSRHQLDAARWRIPEGTFVEGSLLDYRGPGADLVIAVEVLMHLSPDDLPAAVANLRRHAQRHVITVDWTEPVAVPPEPWNVRHDYSAVGLTPLETVGLQTIHRGEPL